MNLKGKISLLVSLLFTLLFAISSFVIYGLFAAFRQEEFKSRLTEKARSSIELTAELQSIKKEPTNARNSNAIDKLYNEQLLIFDSSFQLLYSTKEYKILKWNRSLLNTLQNKKSFFKTLPDAELLGIAVIFNHKKYYALISATDYIGKRKLHYLLFILIITYVFFTAACWVITYSAIKRLLSPLDIFHKKIKRINEKRLGTRIRVQDKKDEIDLLAHEFNQMMERINSSYKLQKEFTANASHELRTPIARIIAQIENKLFDQHIPPAERQLLSNILTDTNQVAALINALLLLSKVENDSTTHKELHRIDELLFEAMDTVSALYTDYKIHLAIQELETGGIQLEMHANKALLIIAFTNLLKNAYLYSHSKQAHITIYQQVKSLQITLHNDGNTLTHNEQQKLFEPFKRGSNAKLKPGSGLGLSIVKKILTSHNATISYKAWGHNSNTFVLTFPY